jgi:hypothetical protein
MSSQKQCRFADFVFKLSFQITELWIPDRVENDRFIVGNDSGVLEMKNLLDRAGLLWFYIYFPLQHEVEIPSASSLLIQPHFIAPGHRSITSARI